MHHFISNSYIDEKDAKNKPDQAHRPRRFKSVLLSDNEETLNETNLMHHWKLVLNKIFDESEYQMTIKRYDIYKDFK